MFGTTNPFGLIILGSETFENDSDADRGSFRTSHDQVLSYFTHPTEGVGLNEKVNCKNLFGSDLSASDQMDQIDEWLERRPHLTDIFVYIVTHGIPYSRDHDQTLINGELYFQLKRSKNGTNGQVTHDSCMRFGALTQVLMGHRQRIHLILDCCYSGLAHNDIQLGRTLSPADTDEMTTIASPPKHSLALLTANPNNSAGEVHAAREQGAEATAFATVLLDILMNGVNGHYPHGISFDALAREINLKMPGHLDQANIKKETREALRLTQVAKVSSDDYDHDDGMEYQVPLALMPVFPNRVPANAYRNQMAQRIRHSIGALKDIQYRHEGFINRIKHDLTAKDAAGEEKSRIISDLDDRLEGMATKYGVLKAEKDALDKKLADSIKKQRNLTVHRRGLAILTVLVVVALGLSTMPEEQRARMLSWIPAQAGDVATE